MPDWKQELRARLAPLRLPPLREAELIEELSHHLGDQYRELVAGGLDPDAAAQRILAGLPPADRLAAAIAPLRLARTAAPADVPADPSRRTTYVKRRGWPKSAHRCRFAAPVAEAPTH